ACGRDATLRQRVEHLLTEHHNAGSFLQNPACTPFDPALPTLVELAEKPGCARRKPGRRISSNPVRISSVAAILIARAPPQSIQLFCIQRCKLRHSVALVSDGRATKLARMRSVARSFSGRINVIRSRKELQ